MESLPLYEDATVAVCGPGLAARLRHAPYPRLLTQVPLLFFEHQPDWDGLLSGRAWFDSGKTIVFGLVGGYFGVELAKWALQIRLKTGDSFAVPVAAAVAVGRLACLAGGCCYGTVTSLPWGVDFGDGQPRHPTQLYEFGFHLAAALMLHQLLQRRLLRGQLIKLYIISYLTYRFLTEFIRPEPQLWAGLTGYHLACHVFIPRGYRLWVESERRPQLR